MDGREGFVIRAGSRAVDAVWWAGPRALLSDEGLGVACAENPPLRATRDIESKDSTR